MKKIIYIRLVWLLCLMAMPCILSAQYSSSSKTYFTPIHIPTVTTEYVTDQNVGSGMTFTGSISYSDGILSGYNGCLTTSNGDQYFGVFNSQMNVPNGSYILYLPASRDYAYQRYCRGNQLETVQTFPLQGRSWYVNGTSIQYYESGAGYSAPATTSSYSNGSSSSSSSSSSHGAICRGCNGTGRCQHCGGSGWVNNHRSKCSLCHGTGRCQSCAGVGKKY